MQARHQADGAGQFCGFGVWAGVLAALDPAAVGRAQGGGEADPAGELAADRLPTGAEARRRQAFAQQVHAVIGEHGQEQVGADAAGLDMENGTQARLALQAAEGGLDFGQLPVRLHDPFRTPLRVAGAQHVHAGLGVARLGSIRIADACRWARSGAVASCAARPLPLPRSTAMSYCPATCR